MSFCPNTSHPDWIELESKIGKEATHIEYIRNGFEIPDPVTVLKNYVLENGVYKKPSYFQLQDETKPTTEQNVKLNNALGRFINSLGLKVENVTSIKDSQGNKINAVGVADLFSKTIQIVEGKANKDTLTEEVSHFLVELLKQSGNPLYKSMMSEIESYDTYSEVVSDYEELYKGSKEKLKEEAIAKLITKIAIEQFEQEGKTERANRWYNKVINFFKDLFGRSKKDELRPFSPFSESAKMLFKESDTPLRDSEGTFFQTEETEGKQIQDKIEATPYLFIPQGKNRYSTMINGVLHEVKNRVSDLVAKADAKRGFQERTELEKLSDEVRRNAGTLGHEDANNILTRLIENRSGLGTTAKVVRTNNRIYSELENYLENWLDTIPRSSKIYTEVKIYDPVKDEAGTIDVLIVDEDGTTHILDYKFIDLKYKTEIPHYKKQNYDIQLREYQRILKSTYGVKKFGQSRIIPISAVYKGDTFTNIVIGNADVSKNKNKILNPISVANEMTGMEEFDKLLSALYQQREAVSKLFKGIKGSTELIKERNRDRIRKKLEDLDEAISDIILKKDLTGFINDAQSVIKRVEDSLDTFSEGQLDEFKNSLGFYSDNLIETLEKLYDSPDFDFKDDVNSIVVNSKLQKKRVENRIIELIKEKNNNDRILDPQKEAGIWAQMFRTLSQQKHPLIRAFYNLVTKSKQATREDLDNLQSKIEDSVSKLREYQKGKGITGEKIFDFMLKTYDNGKLSVINKFNSSFYSERDKQVSLFKKGTKSEKIKAKEWFKNNMNFDKEGYEELYNSKVTFWNEYYKDDVGKEYKIEKKKEQFELQFGNNPIALSRKQNPFAKPKDIHQSNEYKNIQSVPELRNFYNLWVENSLMFQKFVGLNSDPRMVWNVQRDLLDRVMANGANSVLNADTVLDNLRVQSGRHLGMVDERTGKPVYEIPVYFQYQNSTLDENGNVIFNSENQSRDLGRVLYMAGMMAYNHKHMAEIEDSAKSIQTALGIQESLLTNGNNDPERNKITGAIQTVIGSSTNLEMFNDFFNYYVYGVKNKTKDIVFDSFLGFGKKEGVKYSSIATYEAIKKYFISKNLAFNTMSIVANTFGGNLNARMIGAKGRYYSNSDYSNSMYNLIPRRDKKAMSAIGFFNMVDGEDYWKKSNDLSISFLTKHLTFNKLMIGQEAGDKLIRNSVLLSMLQSHTVEDGKIVKISEQKKGAESLYDKISIDKEKFDIGNISEEELTKFRRKALAVGDNILGNNNRDDIRRLHLTVLGRTLSMFRGWIPRMVDERYGELRYNEDVEGYELGRYVSFISGLRTHALGSLQDLVQGFGLFGFGGSQTQASIDRAKLLYEKQKSKALEKGNEFNIGEDEFIQLHYENLRATMMEIQLIGTTFLLLAMAGGFDDDKDKGARKYFIKQMQRNLTELTFFFSPSQFNKIIKSPIPILGFANDFGSLLKTVSLEGYEEVTRDESYTKPNDLKKYSFKVFPVLNGIEKLFEFTDDDYDKYNITDSKGK